VKGMDPVPRRYSARMDPVKIKPGTPVFANGGFGVVLSPGVRSSFVLMQNGLSGYMDNVLVKLSAQELEPFEVTAPD